MLKRPPRPLPRRFNRPLTPQTRSFVERRHRRAREHSRERIKRMLRRVSSALAEWAALLRRWLLVSILLVLLLIFGMLLFSPILRVREIRVIRSEGRVDIGGVLTSLSDLYGRHLLFLPLRDVANRVRDVVPDISDVKVQKNYPSQLTVRIALDPLVARLQIDEPSGRAAGTGSVVTSGTGTIVADMHDFLTEKGMYVSTVNSYQELALPTFRIVDWAVRPVPNTQLITPEFLTRMRQAEETLHREFNQDIRSRTVFVRAREFHLGTPTISFWFDSRGALEPQLGRLRNFLQSVKLEAVKNYIDLRLAGRVVYK